MFRLTFLKSLIGFVLGMAIVPKTEIEEEVVSEEWTSGKNELNILLKEVPSIGELRSGPKPMLISIEADTLTYAYPPGWYTSWIEGSSVPVFARRSYYGP